jgi:hypothetical protein
MVIELKPKDRRGTQEPFVLHVDSVDYMSNEVRINLSPNQNNPTRIRISGMVYKFFLEHRNLITLTYGSFRTQVKTMK